jgi:drug/metabolite transporter (DMT)-like permease
MGNNKPLQAHLSLLSAEIFWGLLAPIGKDAMLHGIDNITLVSFRVTGAALLFWIASLFVKERMPWRHVLFMAGAALLGVVFNQCLYTFGLSYTSPVNASIVTTSMPIFAMVLSFFILREPLTWMKVGGVLIGCIGAISLILSSAHSGGKTGNIWGDLMCMGAQLSFALYLTIFNPLIRKYNVVTVNKWMFTWSCIFLLPFTGSHVAQLPVAVIASKTWAEVFYVVVFGTFLSYLLAVVGQRVLRPDRGERIQLRAARSVGHRECPHGPEHLHRSPGHRRHLHLLRRLARDKVEVEEGYGDTKKMRVSLYSATRFI